MSNKIRIIIQTALYLASLSLVYWVIPILDGLQPYLFSNKVGKTDYEQCLNLPMSQLNGNVAQYPPQTISLPAHVSLVKMMELQSYDLCMRRYKIQTDIGVFKAFSNEKLKMSLGFNYQSKISRNNFQKIQRLISVLIIYYPFPTDQLAKNDLDFLLNNLDVLSLEKLLYICLAKKQFEKADENMCFSYENRNDLIIATRGNGHD